MAEPTIIFEANEGTEGTPTWASIATALRWTGPAGIGDPFPAPVLDADDAFFDNAASPNDGEFWSDTGVDVQLDEAGRNSNRNVIRVRETGGTDATADPPELSAFDDATDAANRTDPSIAILAGTAGSSTISFMRAGETTSASVGGNWNTQVHDAAPTGGNPLDGNKTGEKVVTAAVLAASGNKTFQVAACAPHDSPAGLTNFVYALLYTYV